jgi:hypothetical protein
MHADIILISAWICPTTSEWIAGHSTVQAVLRGRPSQTGR